MKKIFTPLLLVMLMAALAHAQTAEGRWALGVHGGKNEYSGDLGNAMFDLDRAFYGFVGLSLHRYLNPSFNLGLKGTYGHYGYWDWPDNFWGAKMDFSLSLAYKLNNGYIFRENARLAPSVFGGGGLALYNSFEGHEHRINDDGADLIAFFGGALDLRITDWMSLRWQTSGNFTYNDERDLVVRNENDFYLKHSAALFFTIGPRKMVDPGPTPEELAEAERRAEEERRAALAAEEARRQAEAERLAAEEAQRQAEAERLAAEEALRKAKEEARAKALAAAIAQVEPILFETAMYEVPAAYRPQADKVFNVLRDYPALKLEVHGHTDHVGQVHDNQDLGKNRADAVKSYLIARGIDPARITAISFGEKQPVADNQTAAGRRLNRRVEFKIIE